MTSDKTDSMATPMKADILLDFALGKKRVMLAELDRKELVGRLQTLLSLVDFRKLRGFTPMRSILTRNGETPIGLAPRVRFFVPDFPTGGEGFLNTQSAVMHNGVLSGTYTYRRTESDDETTNLEMVRSWGKSAYLSSAKERILVMIRPANNSTADENLVLVDSEYAKVLHEQRYIITSVAATPIPIERFFSFFGEKTPGIARNLLWQLRDIHSQTLRELVSQTDKMREDVANWNRLADSIG